MDKLTQDFSESLFTNSIDIIKDNLEVGIDCFIKDGILKELPIVSTIVSGLKIVKSIQDRNLLKRILEFINELNDGTIDPKKLNQYKESIKNDENKCERDMEIVLFYLDRFVDKEKSVFLARLFKAYINQDISWDDFCEYSEIVNRLFIKDIKILRTIYKEDINLEYTREDEFRTERLYSIGLIGMSFKALTVGNMKDGKINTGRTISPLGKRFCDIILDKE